MAHHHTENIINTEDVPVGDSAWLEVLTPDNRRDIKHVRRWALRNAAHLLKLGINPLTVTEVFVDKRTAWVYDDQCGEESWVDCSDWVRVK